MTPRIGPSGFTIILTLPGDRTYTQVVNTLELAEGAMRTAREEFGGTCAQIVCADSTVRFYNVDGVLIKAVGF